MAEIESKVAEENEHIQQVDPELSEETAKIKQEYELKLQNVNKQLQQLEVDLTSETGKRRMAEERLEAHLDMSVIYCKRVTDLEKQITCRSDVTPHPIPNPRPGLVKTLKVKIEELQQKVKELEETKTAMVTELEQQKEQLIKDNASFRKEIETLRETVQERDEQLAEMKDVKQQSIAMSDSSRQLQEKLNYAVQDLQLRETERIHQQEEIKLLKKQIDEMGNQLKRMEADNRILEERVSTIPELQQLQRDQEEVMRQYRMCCQQKEQLAQEYKVVQENLDEVMARFMSAEEVVGEKESDIKAMKAKIEELEEKLSTIPELQQLQRDQEEVMRQYQMCCQQKEQLAQEYKVVQENLDEVTARFMSAEELIGEKESDIKAMEAKIEELEERASTIPVLQQQSEVWKIDFETEHEAREKVIEEKEQILHDLDQLRKKAQDAAYLRDENQLLIDELDALRSEQLHELQQSQADIQGYHQLETSKKVQLNETKANPTGTSSDGYSTQPEPIQTQSTYGPVTCPKCGLQVQDLDTFQIHAFACIE